MSDDRDVVAHYASGDLLTRLNAALAEDGVDPARATQEDLAPYDQFHGRGLDATLEIAALMQAGPADHLLDIGSGIGGPARFFAVRFGCRITGIDLTPEFCDVARRLTRQLGLQDRVRFETGNALALPFASAQFDGAYSMNVSMNIPDKETFYREAHRVLKPGGWLVLSEIARGTGAEPEYPTPWARTAASSYLVTAEATRAGLAAAGFEIVVLEDKSEAARAFSALSRAMVARGEKPPHRAVMLIHGAIAAEATANTGRAAADGRIVPIVVLARKRAA
jgi:ubiquinone/menaquinone biosynthesis C-methylase UbiE